MRLIAGNGLRPEIWDEFTSRFGIARVCEFYAASEGNTAFINIFNVPRDDRHVRRCRWRTSSTTPTPALRCAARTAGCSRVPAGEPGLLLSPVNRLQPFDGYTDRARAKRSWCATLSGRATAGSTPAT